MSGLIFLADVIAFVVVVSWACAAEAPGRGGGGGLLGIKLDGEAGEKPAAAPAPRWSRAPQAGVRGFGAGATPGWRRTLASGPTRRG
jgi:hypothetical protein